MEQKHKFPTEVIELPSKGLLYEKDSPLASGKIEMKYMTAREEDILTNQSYINKGTVIDKLLEALIVTKVNYDDLLIGDKNALLVAARILGYGKDYEFEIKGEKHQVDLSTLDNRKIDKSVFGNGNSFEWTTPTTDTKIKFKLLTHGDESKIAREIEGLKKINKNASPELSTRLKYMITSVNGDEKSESVREFVDYHFLARDSRAFRKHITNFQPDVDLTITVQTGDGGEESVDIPIGLTFFWPDATV